MWKRVLNITPQITDRDWLEALFRDIARFDVLSITQEVALSKIIHWELLSSDEADSLRRLIDWKRHRDTFVTKKEELSNTLDWNTWDSKNDLKKIKWEDLWITKQQAIEILTKCNLRFVVSVAKQYKKMNPRINLWELINEWSIWLIKAAPRFDYTRWFKFISYAVWWIRQSILQFLSQEPIIKHPQATTSLMLMIWRFEEIILQKEKRLPTKNEIKEALGITDVQYENYLNAYFTSKNMMLSFDKPFADDNENTLYDIIGDQYTQSPDNKIIEETEKSGIIRVLERLMDNKQTYQEALACALFYWLNPKWKNPEEKNHTCEEISEIFKREYGIDRSATSIKKSISDARNNLWEKLTPDWQVSEKYKREFEQEHAIDLQISDIIWNNPIEDITRALNQLINKEQTKPQAKIFSLYSWIPIPGKFNLNWKKHTIEKIAQEFGRSEMSIRKTLGFAVEKLIDKLQKYQLQHENLLQTIKDNPMDKINTNKWSNSPEINIPMDKINTNEWNNSPEIKIFPEPWFITKKQWKNPKKNKVRKNTPKIWNNLPYNIVIEHRDPFDLHYRKGKIIEALEVLKQEGWKWKKDRPKALCLYYWLNPDWILNPDWRVYYGESFAKELGREYGQSATRTLWFVEEKIASILGIDLPMMKKILENIRNPQRIEIRKILRNYIWDDETIDKTVNERIDTTNINHRIKEICKALNVLLSEEVDEKRTRTKTYDIFEVFVSYIWLNPNRTVWEEKKPQEMYNKFYTTTILNPFKRKIADKLGIQYYVLEEILKNIRKSNDEKTYSLLKKSA